MCTHLLVSKWDHGQNWGAPCGLPVDLGWYLTLNEKGASPKRFSIPLQWLRCEWPARETWGGLWALPQSHKGPAVSSTLLSVPSPALAETGPSQMGSRGGQRGHSSGPAWAQVISVPPKTFPSSPQRVGVCHHEPAREV